MVYIVTMKSLILAFLLFTLPLFAEETNTITFTITTTVALKQITPFNVVSSNIVSSLIITNELSPKTKLLIEIRKMEEKIYELTNGIPTSYSGNSSNSSTNMINRLEEIWIQYDKAISNLNIKKLEFKQTP